MHIQEILDNAPEGATHWDGDYLKAGKDGFMFIDEDDSAEWDYQDTPVNASKIRALSDMSKINRLEYNTILLCGV